MFFSFFFKQLQAVDKNIMLQVGETNFQLCQKLDVQKFNIVPAQSWDQGMFSFFVVHTLLRILLSFKMAPTCQLKYNQKEHNKNGCLKKKSKSWSVSEFVYLVCMEPLRPWLLPPSDRVSGEARGAAWPRGKVYRQLLSVSGVGQVYRQLPSVSGHSIWLFSGHSVAGSCVLCPVSSLLTASCVLCPVSSLLTADMLDTTIPDSFRLVALYSKLVSSRPAVTWRRC